MCLFDLLSNKLSSAVEKILEYIFFFYKNIESYYITVHE